MLQEDMMKNRSCHSSEEEAAAALLLSAGGSITKHGSFRSEIFKRKGDSYGEVKSNLFQNNDKSTSTYVSPVISSSSIDSVHKQEHPQTDEHVQVSHIQIAQSHSNQSSLTQQHQHHFPSQLHDFLNKAHSQHAGVIAEWLPHGCSWRLLRWDALKKPILSKFFPQCVTNSSAMTSTTEERSNDDNDQDQANVDTFTWQINAWGFEEIRSGPDRGSFRHDLFLRDQPELCHQMKLNMQSILEQSTSESSVKAPSTYVYTPIIEAPHDASCTPPQVVRHSFPLSTQISPQSGIHENMMMNDHQNVFRQRSHQLFVTPNRAPSKEQKAQAAHRRVISNSTATPFSHPQNQNNSFQESNNSIQVPSMISLSHSHGQTEPLLSSSSGLQATSSSILSNAVQETQAPPYIQTTGLRSSRGRSRSSTHMVRSRVHNYSHLSSTALPGLAKTPPTSSQNSPIIGAKKQFTVSSRGGSKQRVSSNSSVLYSSPSPKMHDVYNLQMLNNNPPILSPQIPHPPPFPNNSMTSPVQSSLPMFSHAPSHSHQQPSKKHPLPHECSYPMAIAVSRKTKRMRKTTV